MTLPAGGGDDMTRFFADREKSDFAGGDVTLSGSDGEHIRVLRMKAGDRITVCDGEGTDYHCVLTKTENARAEAKVIGLEQNPAEPSIRCTVLAGMSKGDRPDYTVQKCTEAGAAEIVFFPCARSVSRPDDKNLEKKLDRWRRIAEEAAKQSGRGAIPGVFSAPDFAAALDIAVKRDLALFMYETGERISLKQALNNAEPFSSVAIMTGPEGGFEEFEADLARAAGLIPCSMGQAIFRCETAPVIALACIMFHTDNY